MEIIPNHIKTVFKAFSTEIIAEVKEFESGHINQTYYLKTNENKYVLQCLNNHVFSNIPEIIENKVNASQCFDKESEYSFLEFYKTISGTYFYLSGNHYWCLMNYIPNSVTHELIVDNQTAFEAGKLYGHFIKTLINENVDAYHEIIPNFHNLTFRNNQLNDALVNTSESRKSDASSLLKTIKGFLNELLLIDQWINEKKILKRVTHNDTKLTNILFDKSGKGLAVIDTDTVMPGCVAYDFGDAVRTICSTAAEDEGNLDIITIDLLLFEQFSSGFSLHLKNIITTVEVDSLVEGVKLMPYIMGVRFLTDYFNNDVYYKTSYEKHNLVRAKNQFRLFQTIINKEKEIKEIIKQYF